MGSSACDVLLDYQVSESDLYLEPVEVEIPTDADIPVNGEEGPTLSYDDILCSDHLYDSAYSHLWDSSQVWIVPDDFDSVAQALLSPSVESDHVICVKERTLEEGGRSGTYAESLVMDGTHKQRLTIRGWAGHDITFDGEGLRRVVTFQNDSLATFVDLTLVNGIAYEGGGMYVDTDLVSLIGVTVADSVAEKDGGGLFISDGAVDMDRVVFRNNTAFRGGGAHLHVHAGISSWSDVVFERNTSVGDGGAVSCVGGSALLIDGLDVLGNAAGGDGAGFYIADCELPDTTRVVFADNVAGGYGGAVALVGTPHVQRFTHATFHGNEAFLGGAFFANGGNELFLDSVSFSENAAVSNGDVFAGYLDGVDTVEVVASNVSGSSYAVDFWNIQSGRSMDIAGFTDNAPEYVSADDWDFCPSHTSPLVSASTAVHDPHDHACDIGGRFSDECWATDD